MADLQNRIQNIDPLNNPAQVGNKKTVLNPTNAPTFSDTLKGFIKDVNHMQNHADKSIEKMVAGEITDVHQVMVAVEEANTAFSLMMELRNKMLDAYYKVRGWDKKTGIPTEKHLKELGLGDVARKMKKAIT